MRRRQRFAQKSDTTPVEVVQEKPVPKGMCPKCKKRIGKGIAFHVKACKA